MSTKPILNLITLPEIIQINSDTGRRYQTPEGNKYPSVSTVLGKTTDTSYLTEWRNRVGHEVADKISGDAIKRGNLLHENIENYLQDIPPTFNMFHTTEKDMFKDVLPFLNEIEEVLAIELPLYSDKLQVAGTVDCIARHGNELYIMDWKNSLRPKTRDEIPNYFKQAAAYAFMFWERTNISINKIKIVMMTVDNGLWIFDELVREWLPEFIKNRETFKELEGY